MLAVREIQVGSPFVPILDASRLHWSHMLAFKLEGFTEYPRLVFVHIHHYRDTATFPRRLSTRAIPIGTAVKTDAIFQSWRPSMLLTT